MAIVIYLVDEATELRGNAYSRALTALPPERRARAERCVHEEDRQRIVVAWLLLRHALHEECGLTDVPHLVYGERGKPSFTGAYATDGQQAARPLPHFNLSHSGRYVACVLAPVEVGIDVQATADAVRHLSPALLARTCSPAEIEALETAGPAGSPACARAFCALWTRKESVIKLTGRGLAEPLPNLLERHSHDVVTVTTALAAPGGFREKPSQLDGAFLSLSHWREGPPLAGETDQGHPKTTQAPIAPEAAPKCPEATPPLAARSEEQAAPAPAWSRPVHVPLDTLLAEQ